MKMMIVCVLQSDRVKIIDRKKNLFKLAQGEYVGPEKIEGMNVLVGSACVIIPYIYWDFPFRRLLSSPISWANLGVRVL